VSTTLLFSGIGTIVFLLVVGNRVPSYTGSSFAFIAPIIAAKADGGIPAALGGVFVTGALLVLVGLVVDRLGGHVVDLVMPPVVTGTIVAIIGLNLAPVAKDEFSQQPWIALATLLAIVLIGVLFRGMPGRLAVVLGVVVGYAVAALAGDVDFDPVRQASWVGLPDFTSPSFDLDAILLVAPVVLVLVAENAGHVKAVAAITGRNLDRYLGRGLIGDGAATMLAGIGGGSGTTTYAENIGVMAVTRVYSTAAYWVAAVVAIALGLLPKFGALVSTIPVGVLGGAVTVLFGMIAVLGARIWIDHAVDFRLQRNLVPAAIALVVGSADFTLTAGDYSFNGIALGTLAAVAGYHVLRLLERGRPERGLATPAEGVD
jgi:uracil-xanthine permease